MTKSSSFFENSSNSSIHGGNFIHTENRATQRQESFFLGPIYGYTHTAANDGPVIGYQQVIINGSNHGRGQHSGLDQRDVDVSLIENFGATRPDIVHDEPGPMTLEDMRIGAGLGRETERDSALATSEPGSLPVALEAEFQTLSHDMQRYIMFHLSRQAVPVESPISNSVGGGLHMVNSDHAESDASGSASATQSSSQ